MNDPPTEWRFWEQIRNDSKRTVACSPGDAAHVREAIEAAGLGDIVTVVASPILRDGQAAVMDTQTVDAWDRQQSQAWRWRP